MISASGNLETLIKSCPCKYNITIHLRRSLDGDWTEIVNAIGKVHAMLHDEGVLKVHTDVRIETQYVQIISYCAFQW